jgi:5,10-methylenetetrahydromethanopterin reductase
VYAAVSDREADALDRYRRHLAITLRGAHHALNVRLGGGTLDQDALHEAVAREDWERAEALVTDDLVRRHTACGTADRVRERIAAYRAAGLDEIVLGGLADPAETTRTLAAVLGAGAPLGGGR